MFLVETLDFVIVFVNILRSFNDITNESIVRDYIGQYI